MFPAFSQSFRTDSRIVQLRMGKFSKYHVFVVFFFFIGLIYASSKVKCILSFEAADSRAILATWSWKSGSVVS